MKRLFAAMTAALLMVALVSSAAVATDGKGHNFVGTQTAISGVIHLPTFTSSHADPLAQPGDPNLFGYSCDSVSRTAYGFGWKDTQTCTLVDTTAAPAKSYSSGGITFDVTWTNHPDGSPLEINTTYGGCSDEPYGTNLNPTIWYSDYTYMASGGSTYEVASSFSYKLTPSGTLTIVSFYPTTPIPDPCF